MCNACGFYCCAYDGFQGCGCDHCYCADCWTDDLDDDYGDDLDCAAPIKSRSFFCDSPSIFSSGDGLGIHQPGSMTRGFAIVRQPASGRARKRAICPAVARSFAGRAA